MTDHAPFYELVAGLALDALEPADEELIAEHLRSCGECQDLLVELQQTAADLAYAIPHEDPPEQLLDRILAAAAADSVVSPRPAEAAATPAAAERVVRGVSGRLLRRPAARLPGRRLSVSVSMRTLAVAAALALVALVGAGVARIHATENNRVAALSRYVSVVSHLADPNATLVSLGSAGAARGTAVVDGRKVFLVVDNLGINDARNSTYVLWAQKRDGSMVGVSAFDVTRDGVTVVAATLPRTVASPAAFAVSHENGHTIPASPSTAVLGPGRVLH